MRGGVSCCFMCGYSTDMSISNYLLTYLLTYLVKHWNRTMSGLSFVMRKISTKFRLDHRQRERPNAGRVGNNCVFRPVEKSLAQTPYRWKLCPSATVVRVHDGALAEEYAVWSTKLVVVEHWLIIVTVQLTSTKLALKILTHGFVQNDCLSQIWWKYLKLLLKYWVLFIFKIISLSAFLDFK